MGKITVIDAMMGSGKTSFTIEYINEHYDDNILYIAPYIEEDKRIVANAKKEIRMPMSFGKGKLNNIQWLLENQDDIASTHALFLRLDSACKTAIKNGHYTLFLDEVISAVEPYNMAYEDDIKYLLEKGSIRINDDGFIEWLDEELDTRFNPIRILAQNHSLFFVNQKLLMWRYPPDIFELFDKVYVMTYLFDSSILKYYFDLHGIKYDIKSIAKENDKYVLCDYFKPNLSSIKGKIHIYEKDDLNDNIPQKITGLSSTWFKNPANKDKIKKLKNNIYNYFMHKEPAKSKQIIWTTFKVASSKLKGKGYSNRFLACNCRATNDYADTDHLAYCLNVYMNVGVSQFFLQHGITINNDKYALSEMIQWIWRSSIRNGKDIWIYVPSKRMRSLLKSWLNGEL